MKRTLAVLTLLFGFSSAAAFADTVNLSLSNSAQSTSTGGTFTYTATISAPISNGADIYLNSDSFNVDVPATLDDTDFLTNFPFTLSPGQSFTGDLFTLSLPAGTPLGTYSGTFSVLGGADGFATTTLGTVTFSATVTPEPSSLILLGTGMAGTITAAKRRRFCSK